MGNTHEMAVETEMMMAAAMRRLAEWRKAKPERIYQITENSMRVSVNLLESGVTVAHAKRVSLVYAINSALDILR